MQAILFGLTFYKFVRHARVRAGRHTLVVHLMRDGAWAFFVLFCKLTTLIIIFDLRLIYVFS